MAMRVPALEFLAEYTGESRVTWEHNARMMNDAPGRYSTALGRGIRHMDMSAEWLVSTFLAGVIGDPKNAALKVPLYGDMQLSQERLEIRDTIYVRDPQSLEVEETVLSRNEPLSPGKKLIDTTFFDALLAQVKAVSQHWNDELHKRVHHGFKVEIHLDGPALAKSSLLWKKDGPKEVYLLHSYAPSVLQSENAGSTKANASAPLEPMQRVGLITGRHLTMLATLLRTTQAQAAPPLALDVAA